MHNRTENDCFPFYGVNYDAIREQECMQNIQTADLVQFLKLGANALKVLEENENCSVSEMCELFLTLRESVYKK